jgi:hypothetical protein
MSGIHAYLLGNPLPSNNTCVLGTLRPDHGAFPRPTLVTVLAFSLGGSASRGQTPASLRRHHVLSNGLRVVTPRRPDGRPAPEPLSLRTSCVYPATDQANSPVPRRCRASATLGSGDWPPEVISVSAPGVIRTAKTLCVRGPTSAM